MDTIRFPFDVDTLVKIFKQIQDSEREVRAEKYKAEGFEDLVEDHSESEVLAVKGFHTLISSDWGIYSYREENGCTTVLKPCRFFFKIASTIGNCQVTFKEDSVLLSTAKKLGKCQVTYENGWIVDIPETDYFKNH